MDTEGDRIIVDIFIDKLNPKTKKPAKKLQDFTMYGYHALTVGVAKWFRFRSKLEVNVHLQQKHVGIYGQWIDSWRPRKGSKELALIVEDDLDLSPYFWKWLKAAYHKYGNAKNVIGFSLRGNEIVAGKKSGQWLVTSDYHNAFMYKLIGSHGFAPVPKFWRDFRAWFRKVSRHKRFKPYVPGITQTQWYKGFEKINQTSGMWSQWAIYYTWVRKLFIVYPNISKLRKDRKGELIVHRAEFGLHSTSRNSAQKADSKLLREWKEAYGIFPHKILKYDWTGRNVSGY